MMGLVSSNLCLGLKSELRVLARRYLPTEKNPEIAIRDWATETTYEIGLQKRRTCHWYTQTCSDVFFS